MSLPSLSGSSISSTYNRLVQTDGNVFADGTGSIIPSLNITSSVAISSSYSNYAVTASYLDTYLPPFPFTGSAEITGSLNVIGPFTASSALITGNVVVLGTASINTLVVNQTQLSTGSNQLGDAADDTQTLYGTVRIPTGSLSVNGQTRITGSLIVSGGIADVWDLYLNQTPGAGNNYTLYWDPDNARVSVGPLPTLQSVTNAGNSTSDPIIVGGLTSSAANINTLYTEDIKPLSNIISVGNAGTDYLFLGVQNPNNLYPLSQYYPFPGIGIYSRDSAASATRGSVIISYSSGSGALGNFQVWSVDNDGNRTERLVINNTGSIGIGTNTPAFKLDVQGTGRFTGNLTVTGSGLFSGSVDVNYLTSIGGISINQGSDLRSSDNIVGWRIRDPFGGAYLYNNSGPFLFHTTQFEIRDNSTAVKHFLANSTGVTIGSTSPSTKLYIEGGSANWNETTPGLGQGTIHLDPDTSSNNFGNAITFGATDDPSSGANAHAGIYIRSDETYGTKMYFATTDNYLTGAKTRMFIGHDGNIGIGTTTPAYALEVVGSSFIQQQIRSTNSAAGLKFVPSSGNNYELQATTTSEFLLYDRTVNAYRLFVNGSGNIGIGTITPGSRLQIKGAGTTTSTNALGVENSSGTNLLTITDGQVSTFGRKSTYTFDPAALYVGNGPFNFETSIVLDAYSGDNSNYKTIIYAGYSYVNPFRITSNNSDIIYAFDGGAGVSVPGVLTQGIKTYQSLEALGYYHHIHSPFGSWPSGIKLTNPSTNTGSTDGVYMGLWTSGIDARLWNYETTGRWDIGVGNVTQATVTTSSVTINSVLTLTPQNPLPTSGVPTGSFAVSSSTPPKPYFWDGASWNALY
jgi:hypothetical protein